MGIRDVSCIPTIPWGIYVLEAAVQRISCSSRLFVGARLFHGVPRYIDTSHGAHANPQLVIRGHLQFPVVVLAGMPTGARARLVGGTHHAIGLKFGVG